MLDETQIYKKGFEFFDKDDLPTDIKLLQQLLELIEKNYTLHRDAEFYALQLNSPLNRLNKLCKLYFNKSVYQLIQERIHLQLISLLKYSTMSLKEISAKLKTCDVAYLCRCFKRITGTTPTKFRKQHQALNWPDRDREQLRYQAILNDTALPTSLWPFEL